MSYRLNKRGFDCALSFSFPLYPGFLRIFLVPHQVSNYLPLAKLSLTSFSSTLLHHEIQLRIIPTKVIFIELFFCKKIPLSRRVGYVMDGSMGQ